MITKLQTLIKDKLIIFLNNRDWYTIKQLQIGGHCGLCGDWIGGEIYPIAWIYGLCNKCLKRNVKEVIDDNNSRIVKKGMKQALFTLSFIFSILPQLLFDEIRKLNIINRIIYWWGWFSLTYIVWLRLMLGDKFFELVDKIKEYIR